jgi:uncharacterized protein (TIGR02391 family)
MARKRAEPAPIEPREFRSPEEIDQAVGKLQRRIRELEQLDLAAAIRDNTGAIKVATSNLRDTIRDVFGPNSPEFGEHKYIDIWSGALYVNMDDGALLEGRTRGRTQVIGIINGLIGRLAEKREGLVGGSVPAPTSYFDKLNLHPRIGDVARELFMDGHHWEAVFAGAKALVNYVKERSARHDLDGAPLMRTVFSRNNPVLVFNNLADQTEQDEQEGMMHLFEGAVLGIRNPGGHSFPEGSEQRAVEYISLLSLLAYRTQEARRRPAR